MGVDSPPTSGEERVGDLVKARSSRGSSFFVDQLRNTFDKDPTALNSSHVGRETLWRSVESAQVRDMHRGELIQSGIPPLVDIL
jgi:hypothetical protein